MTKTSGSDVETPASGARLILDRRRFGLGVAATAAAVSTSGWIRAARAAAGPPVKVGVLLPRSGFLALIGQACQRGCDLAVPILSDLGYSIELMNADTESSPDVARTQAERLIREGANVLVGAFESGATMAIAQVAEQRGVPFVINLGADPKITEQGFKYTFRNFPTSVMLTQGGLSLMNDLFKATGKTPKTAVLTYVNDSFGQSMQNVIGQLVPKMGLPFTIVETIAYDPKARDLSVEVAKAKAANAELHVAVSRLNDAIVMVREMVKQRYEPMGIIGPGNPGMYEKQFLKTLGKYAEYVITNVPWFDPKQPLNGTLQTAFEKAYPDETYELNVGFSFEAILVCADAYKRAGSAAPQALAEALRKTNLQQRVMIGGPIRFDEKGQNVDLISAAVQNRNGRPTVVLPAASAEMAPVFPMPGWSART
jgi:branched-chain amino acid transport system substrate-binding protein